MFYGYFTYITVDNDVTDVAGAVKTRLAREYYIIYYSPTSDLNFKNLVHKVSLKIIFKLKLSRNTNIMYYIIFVLVHII